MKRLALALSVLAIALGANAALLLRPEATAEQIEGAVRVQLGDHAFDVARNLIRDRAQLAGGRLDRLDLAVAIQDFAPLPPLTAREALRPMPDRLSIILTAATAAQEGADPFQLLYARFLSRETWSNPGGLVMRRFRPGTPYEDRELYLGVGGRRTFVALCPLDAQREIEPCTASANQDGIEVELRFNARHLPEWRQFAPAAGALVAGLLATAKQP